MHILNRTPHQTISRAAIQMLLFVKKEIDQNPSKKNLLVSRLLRAHKCLMQSKKSEIKMMKSSDSHKCNFRICRKRLENAEMKRGEEFICKMSKSSIIESKNFRVVQKCHLNLHLRIVARDTRNQNTNKALNK